MQVTGARSFASDAVYAYTNARARTQTTGTGLPATVRELVTELASAQSTISEHLAVLRECGLVVASEENRKGAYHTDVHHLRRLKALVGSSLMCVLVQASQPSTGRSLGGAMP